MTVSDHPLSYGTAGQITSIFAISYPKGKAYYNTKSAV